MREEGYGTQRGSTKRSVKLADREGGYKRKGKGTPRKEGERRWPKKEKRSPKGKKLETITYGGKGIRVQRKKSKSS